MSQDQLTNKGIVNLFGQSEDKPTIIILGPPRSGTSMIAGVLHHLGVFMGEKAQSPVFEDLHLSLAIERGDKGLVGEIIGQYNHAHDVWGWKRPMAISYLDQVINELRNPIFICPFKDVLSIANRNQISMGDDVLSGLINASGLYHRLISLVSEYQKPSFLFSYEKVLQDKPSFLKQLCDFAGLKPNEKQWQAALNFIDPNSTEYKEKTTILSKGEVLKPQRDKVTGWLKEGVKPELFISINGVELAIDPVFNQEIKDGKRAFSFDLKQAGFCLVQGDVVEVASTQGLILRGQTQTHSAQPSTQHKRFTRKNLTLCVTDFTHNEIKGWVVNKKSPEPLMIEVKNKGQIIHSAKADHKRPLLKKKKIHETGRCGFLIRKPKFTEDDAVTLWAEKKQMNAIPLSFSDFGVMPKKTPLIFVHIAKAAGSSINQFFIDQFGADKVRTHVQGDRENLVKHINHCEFISGHLRLPIFDQYNNGQFRYLTFLRDPVEHLLSHLHWVKLQTEEDKFKKHVAKSHYLQQLSEQIREIDFNDLQTVSDFLTHLPPKGRVLFDNCQTRYLNLVDENEAITDRHALMAYKRLEQFFFVGFVEDMHQSMQRLAEKVGFDAPQSPPHENKNEKSQNQISPEVRSYLEDYLRFDYLLYQAAKKLTF